MASGIKVQTCDSESDADSTSAASVKSDAKMSISNTEHSSDISSGGKWEFRPPPRGLTPNEYVLCDR